MRRSVLHLAMLGVAALLTANAALAQQKLVLGENLFLSPRAADLARQEGSLTLNDPRLICQSRSDDNGQRVVCYTRTEVMSSVKALRSANTGSHASQYTPGYPTVVSQGVRALLARENHLNPYTDRRVRCQVMKLPSSALSVNFCQTMNEAQQARDSAERFLMTSRVMIQTRN